MKTIKTSMFKNAFHLLGEVPVKVEEVPAKAEATISLPVEKEVVKKAAVKKAAVKKVTVKKQPSK